MQFRGQRVVVRDRPAALSCVLQLVAIPLRQEFRRYPFPGIDAETCPRDVLVIDDLLAVFVCRDVARAVIGDAHDFIGPYFRLDFARARVLLRKYLVFPIGQSAHYGSQARHGGVLADVPDAFPFGEACTDFGCDLGRVPCRPAAPAPGFRLRLGLSPIGAWFTRFWVHSRGFYPM